MRKLIVAFVACMMVAAVGAADAASDLGVKKSSAGGVTVAVTPMSVEADAKIWEFKVVLDTHSQELSDDLAKSSALLDGTGGRCAPIAWEGAGPGGHHRAGTLRFDAPSQLPDEIELQIRRPGETEPRSFRWRLK